VVLIAIDVSSIPTRVCVHDADDEDEFRFDGVENEVREYPHQAASYVFIKHAPSLRGVDNLFDGDANLTGEALTQVASALFVEPHCFRELIRRFGMKNVPHSLRMASMRR
jgi:hypothetical protein